MIVPARDEIPGVDEQRAEQLYRLLPAIYRLRDEQLAPPAQGNGPRRGPLFELLSVIALGAEELEADIARLYNDAFIETCADWVVPYIADLVGYRPVDDAGAAGSPVTPAGQALNRALTSRREVANTIYLRRRKGALHLLEQLAHAVAGWPARAVEGFERVATAPEPPPLASEGALPIGSLGGPHELEDGLTGVPRPACHRDREHR